jgi:homogentisate 1,2-dioxygenase
MTSSLRLMVRPGELLVIQRGMKFKVKLPDGPSRGCAFRAVALTLSFILSSFSPLDIQEIFGSHYQLPELGPLGGHGLANARDFESPVASFDIDQSPWESE